MMCCKECPFHPLTGSAPQRCRQPLCRERSDCYEPHCMAKLGFRCYQDQYVLKHLAQKDALAEKLVFYSLKTALLGRDRALLLSIFQAADDRVRASLWQWLTNFEPRSLWMLNPIFQSAGLAPLDNLAGVGSRREQYFAAIMANPYAGGCYRPVLTLATAGGY